MYIYVCVGTYVRIRVCRLCVCRYVGMYIIIRVCRYVGTYVRICVCRYVHTYVCT